MFYLIHLKKSICSGRVHYLKPNEIDCTTKLKNAGLYSVENAYRVMKREQDGLLIMVEQQKVTSLWSKQDNEKPS